MKIKQRVQKYLVCSKYNNEQTDKDHTRANVIHLIT